MVKDKINKILDSSASVTFYKAKVIKVLCCKNHITLGFLVFRLEFKHGKELPW